MPTVFAFGLVISKTNSNISLAVKRSVTKLYRIKWQIFNETEPSLWPSETTQSIVKLIKYEHKKKKKGSVVQKIYFIKYIYHYMVEMVISWLLTLWVFTVNLTLNATVQYYHDVLDNDDLTSTKHALKD